VSQHDKVQLVGWLANQSSTGGTLLGRADIVFFGLRIDGCPVFRGNDGKPWATVPQWPKVEGRRLVTDSGGKPVYENKIYFVTPKLRSAFSDRVIAALRAAYPDAITPERMPRLAFDDER
jgi:hypothetical protein